MANYNVGNIEIGVVSNSKSAISSIDKIISKLRELDKVSKSLNVDSIKNITDTINGISTQSNFTDATKSLSKFINALNRLNKIPQFDTRKIYGTFSSLTRIIDPFLTKIRESESSLVALSNAFNSIKSGAITKANNQLEKTKNTTQKIETNTNKINANFRLFPKLFNVGKLYLLFNYSKRILASISKLMNYASDYIEILNKFQVSFGNLYQENLKSINQLAQAFGFSTNTLMDYTATFNNMLQSLGNLSAETNAMISQTLTRMAIDYSSLFNVSIQRAMEAFQSAISGNIRTLRSISGFDVSEITIFSIYQELGGTKTMRQLNQLEKRLLRIIAIQRQMEATGTLGDYARTIETTSNQVKILKETLIEVGKWIGMNLLVYIKPAIQYTNAILLTLKEMFKALALVKEQTDNINYEEEFAGFSESISETTDYVNELNEAMGTLLGFDTLNILGDNGATSMTDGLSVEGTILDALKKYSITLDKVNFKAKNISENILSWLGYTKILNKETGEYNWVLGEGNTNLEKIKNVAIGTITSLLSFGIISKITALSMKIKDVVATVGASGSSSLLGKFSLVALIVTTIVTGFADAYKTSENFKQSVDNSFSNIKENLTTIWNFLKNDFYPKIQPVIEFIWNAVKNIGAIILDKILKHTELITEILTGDFKGAVQVVKQLFLDIDGLLARIFGEENWNNFKEIIKNVLTSVGEWFKNSWFAEMFNWFKELFNEISRIFNEYIKPLFQAMGESWLAHMKPKFDDFIASFKAFYNDIILPLVEIFKNTLPKVWDIMVEHWKGVANLIIGSINKIIQGLNKISFEFPDWVPGIGGKTFGINIPEIPYLAKGGVIDKPTMAMVGEYAGAKSNPEIVTPESLMRKVFAESMLPIAQAIMSGNNEVVGAIGDLANRPIELNGRKVSQNIYDDLQKEAKRRGANSFNITR